MVNFCNAKMQKNSKNPLTKWKVPFRFIFLKHIFLNHDFFLLQCPFRLLQIEILMLKMRRSEKSGDAWKEKSSHSLKLKTNERKRCEKIQFQIFFRLRCPRTSGDIFRSLKTFQGLTLISPLFGKFQRVKKVSHTLSYLSFKTLQALCRFVCSLNFVNFSQSGCFPASDNSTKYLDKILIVSRKKNFKACVLTSIDVLVCVPKKYIAE